MFWAFEQSGRMPSILLVLFFFVAGMASMDLLVLGGRNRPAGEIGSREVILDGKLQIGGHELSFVPDGETARIYVVGPGYPPELAEGLPVDNFEAPAVTEALRVLVKQGESGVRVRIRGILAEKQGYRRGFGFGTRRNYPRMILVLELKRLEL